MFTKYGIYVIIYLKEIFPDLKIDFLMKRNFTGKEEKK